MGSISQKLLYYFFRSFIFFFEFDDLSLPKEFFSLRISMGQELSSLFLSPKKKIFIILSLSCMYACTEAYINVY